MKLRDGSETSDPRLDLIFEEDGRSREFGIRDWLSDKPRKSRRWPCRRWLDQGKEGACVGYAIAHELIAKPVEVPGINGQYAKTVIYWGAQASDKWPGGSYPGADPQYEGTSMLAGVKFAQRLGWFESYHWAFGLQDLIMGIAYEGPAVMATQWYSGMNRPDRSGFVKVTGDVTGRHCFLCRGVSLSKKWFLIRNSWGRDWGDHGDCYITFSGMERLLEERGHAVFFRGRRRNPMEERADR